MNHVPFLKSISNHVHYGTFHTIDNLKADALESGVKNVTRCYAIRGFNIVVVMVDVQFKCLKDRNRLDKPMNTVSRGEHAKQIKRFHRVIKERSRCNHVMLLFNTLPCMMVVHLMIAVVFYENAFAWMDGVLKILSPLTIVEGTTLDFNLHFRVIFGEFVQTYDGTNNAMSLRSTDAIALSPNSNLQGGIICFSLATGKMFQRQWQDVEIYNIPVTAISRINCVCVQQRAIKVLKFGDRQNRIYDVIRTGVIEDAPTTDSSHNIPNPDISTNAMQHYGLVANEEHHLDNDNDAREVEAI